MPYGLEVPCKLIFEGNVGDISILLANRKEDDKKAKGPVSTTAEEVQAIDADKKGNDLESDQQVAKRKKAEAGGPTPTKSCVRFRIPWLI